MREKDRKSGERQKSSSKEGRKRIQWKQTLERKREIAVSIFLLFLNGRQSARYAVC